MIEQADTQAGGPGSGGTTGAPSGAAGGIGADVVGADVVGADVVGADVVDADVIGADGNRDAACHRAVAQLGPPALIVIDKRSSDAQKAVRTVAWANASATDLLTLCPDDVVARPLGDVGDPAPVGLDGDWRNVVADLIRRDGGQAPALVQRTDSRQQPVWLRVSRTPDRADLEPDAATWLVQLTETSDELAAARESALEAEHRFEALARRAPIGIFVSEVGLRLGYVNQAFSAMTGRPAEFLLGTGWLDLVHATDRAQVYEAVETALAGTLAEMSVRILTVANGQRWVQARLAPVTTPRRSAGFIGTIEDITARRAWEEQLAYQAMHDPLTGLANRRRLVQALEELLEGQRAHDRQFAVLFCDLDGFKAINDSLGHDAGDRVLIEVARRLASTARDRDVVARVAGDEFVVVLRSVQTHAEAQASAKRHLAALGGPVYVSGRDIDISASVGVAFPMSDDTPETVLRAADRVMYEAKSTGRGQMRLARQSPPDSSRLADSPWTPPAPRRRSGEGRSQ